MKNPSRKGVPRGVSMVWGPRKADVVRMYTEEKKSQAEIAAHYGVSQTLMPGVFRRLGIASRPRWRCGEENGRFKDGSEARGYRSVVVKTMCATCGATEDLGIHHKNDDHYDNRPVNLEVLCNRCHMRLTKQKWWAAKKRGDKPTTSNAPIRWGAAVKSQRRPRKGRCVLSADEVRGIRSASSNGDSYATLAARHGVATSTIQAIVNGKSW